MLELQLNYLLYIFAGRRISFFDAAVIKNTDPTFAAAYTRFTLLLARIWLWYFRSKGVLLAWKMGWGFRVPAGMYVREPCDRYTYSTCSRRPRRSLSGPSGRLVFRLAARYPSRRPSPAPAPRIHPGTGTLSSRRGAPGSAGTHGLCQLEYTVLWAGAHGLCELEHTASIN